MSNPIYDASGTEVPEEIAADLREAGYDVAELTDAALVWDHLMASEAEIADHYAHADDPYRDRFGGWSSTVDLDTMSDRELGRHLNGEMDFLRELDRASRRGDYDY